ncbi:hypothetical protein M948_14500 [Virgibacillus sp. CM-4]|nr:hypothetical protein M948_14500 [Virgibacillus sp. CM-4]
MLNIGSLLLGLIAWILPIVNMAKYNNNDFQKWAIVSLK